MQDFRHRDWLRHHARLQPERPCWTDLHSNRAFTFAEAEARVSRLAAHLQRACGVDRGDRVAVLCMNSTDMLEVWSACAKIGAIFLPLNWRLAPPEIDFILSDGEPQALIFDTANADTVKALEWTGATLIETSGGGGDTPYEAAITGADGDYAEQAMGHDDAWTILYTSGTTGRPKGAINTYGMAFWNAVNLGIFMAVTPQARGITLLPLFHTGGLNCYAAPLLHAGGSSLVMRAFDAGAALRLIGDPEVGMTHFFGVPANYLFMAQHPDFPLTDFSRLVRAGIGGAPAPVPLLEAWKAKGVALVQGFGMSETSPAVCFQDAERAFAKPGSAGRSVHYGEMKVVLEDGTDAGVNEVGELWVRGPNIMPGYWRRPEATAASFTGEWFHTGDAARIDEDGDCWIVDRWKDMFISGGENVYPAEVESAMHALPEVADVAVVGEPSDKWGETGVAFVVPAEGAQPTEADILGALNGRLARYKIPKRVIFTGPLPRNATGKIVKAPLRERIRAGE